MRRGAGVKTGGGGSPRHGTLQTPERSWLLGQQSPQGVAEMPLQRARSLTRPRPRPQTGGPVGACVPARPRSPFLDPKAQAAPSSPSHELLRFRRPLLPGENPTW